MKLNFFSISSLSPDQGQTALNLFCAQHRVVSVEKQFVALGMESFWSICVTTIEGKWAEPSNENQNLKRDRIDYKEILSEQDFTVFAELRNLRKSLAEQEGVPAYALFTNEQLATMVTQRVQNIVALGSIEGIGKARLEKYGGLFLHALQSAMTGRPKESDAAPTN